MMDRITPLHVRSGHSLLRGTALPAALAARAAELDHAAIALTDVNSLAGAPAFWQAATDAGLQPLVGAEMWVGRQSILALITSDTGYANLCQLITHIHAGNDNLASPEPEGLQSISPGQRPWDPSASRTSSPEGAQPSSLIAPLQGSSEVVAHNPGLRPGLTNRGPSALKKPIALADLGVLADGLEIIVDDPALAEALLAAGWPTGRLWLGVDPACQSYAALRKSATFAQAHNLPLVATAKALLASADDSRIARLLTAMRLQTTDDAVPDAQLPPPGAFLRSAGQLAPQLADWPEAIANNQRLVETCAEFKLLPRRAVFPSFECPDGLTPMAYLKQLCRKGLTWRYRTRPPAGWRERLRRELALIEAKGFGEYFLVVWDIVQYARRQGAPVAGRGSGASSLVAYLLGITNVCPLDCEIPFERFLNDLREDFPDLDIDFCWRIRDDVIDDAIGRWGDDRVAMVCTHSTFQDRSALRETAKAMGFSEQQISKLGDMDHPEKNPRLIEAARLSRRLIGLPHNFSVHPGGIVMAPDRLDRFAPLQPAAKGVRVTQFDKDGVEAMGLVKLDLLGNRSLSTIRAACNIIRQRSGEDIDPERVDTRDAPTLAVLRAGDTVGCNQLESPAMRNLLRGLQPQGLKDVMKALALIRPGAASIGMKETFVRRHRGLEDPPPSDPRVDAILAETYGVMLYEDDVMLLAAAMTGTSRAQGDRFRKAVQKCRNDDERLALSRDFLTRCSRQGLERTLAEDIWVQMAKFNAYSFCRAHAASYAKLAWAVAYLKTHWPLAFWVAALCNNQSLYHPRVYVEQAKRCGIEFLLPDVNASAEEFAIERDAIGVGLNFVAGLGPAGVKTILNARQRGRFVNLTDFLARTGLDEAQTQALVLCGAFDALGRARPALMMELNLAHKAQMTRSGGCCLLPAEVTLPAEPNDYSTVRKLADERRILGISVGPHVMAMWRPSLHNEVTIDSRHLAANVGKNVRIAGVLEAMRTTLTQQGSHVTFLTLDDEFGLFEAVVFERGRPQSVRGYGPHVVDGRVQRQYDTITVVADRISSWPRGKGR